MSAFCIFFPDKSKLVPLSVALLTYASVCAII